MDSLRIRKCSYITLPSVPPKPPDFASEHIRAEQMDKPTNT